MKKIVCLGAVVALYCLSGGTANAVTYFNASPSAFRAANPDQNECLNFSVPGSVRFWGSNSSACVLSSIDITAPVFRNAKLNPQAAQNVFVDGLCTGATPSCTLDSYDYDGSFLGSVTHNLGGPTHFDVKFSLTAAQQTASSYETLYCTLPQHISGIQSCSGLYGYQVEQN